MKKQLLIALLAFTTLPFFAAHINQQRLILLEQLRNMIIMAQQEQLSLEEMPESASMLRRIFTAYFPYPTKKHDVLLLNIATDMYHNSNDPVTTKMKIYSRRLAIRFFNDLNTLEHNETWLDAVKNHGIHSEETQEILEDLAGYVFTNPYCNDDDENDNEDNNEDDTVPTEDEIELLYPVYVTFYKKHTGHSPNKDDIDRDIESLLEFLSVPRNTDVFNQLLQKISIEITTIKKSL